MSKKTKCTVDEELVMETHNCIDDLIEIQSDPITTENSDTYPWSMYITNQNEKKVYSVYIYNEIFEPSYYSRLFQLIRNLNETDQLHIHLNSPGGSLYTLIAFVNVIQDCKAHVTMIVDGFAESAAAVLAFVGDTTIVRVHSSMMFHNIHTTNLFLQDSGKIKANIEYLHKVYKNMLITFCSKILSKNDIKNIIENGAEIYFSGEEILKKLV